MKGAFNSHLNRCGILHSRRSDRVLGRFGVQTLTSATETSGFYGPCDVDWDRSKNFPWSLLDPFATKFRTDLWHSRSPCKMGQLILL